MRFRLKDEKGQAFATFLHTNQGARLHLRIQGTEAWTEIVSGGMKSPHQFPTAAEAHKWASLLAGPGGYEGAPGWHRSVARPTGLRPKPKNP